MDMFPNQMQMYNCSKKIDDDSIPLQALYIKQGMDAGFVVLNASGLALIRDINCDVRM